VETVEYPELVHLLETFGVGTEVDTIGEHEVVLHQKEERGGYGRSGEAGEADDVGERESAAVQEDGSDTLGES
jgi:hypothetical protein